MAFDWHTWSSSRCYEKPECVMRSSSSPNDGHTCPDRLALRELEHHILKPKLDIRCIWLLRHTVRDRISYSCADHKTTKAAWFPEAAFE